MGRKVSKWSQSVLCATVLGSESVYSWCDPVKRLEYWLAFMEELFFQVLKNLVAHVSSMGVILDLIEMQMVAVDPPIQKTPP